MDFPCKDGRVFDAPEMLVESWQDAYKGVDVPLELKRARLWLEANPARLKSFRGMPRFLLGWIARQTPTDEPLLKNEPTPDPSRGWAETLRLQQQALERKHLVK